MCTKILFTPNRPCCNVTGLCKRFPSVDWNKVGWAIRHPGALLAEVLYVPKSYGGPVINFGAGDPDNGKYSYSGLIGSTNDVLFSWHGYHMRAGLFRVEYSGGCQWVANCRERLCPWQYRLAIDSSGSNLLNADSIVSNDQQWTGYRGLSSDEGDRVTGPFTFWDDFGGGERFFNWRDVLRAAECVVIPALEASGSEITAQESIEGGLLYRLEQARSAIIGVDTVSNFLKPTAIDLAIEFSITGGIHFGVESDTRSPYFDQLIISEGGQYESETIDDVTTTWLTSTPWEPTEPVTSLSIGDIVRFNRTDDNDCLPAWVELELIRI